MRDSRKTGRAAEEAWATERARLGIRVSHFYPKSSLVGKRNYKRYLYFGQDSEVRECVHLHVDDPRKREELICLHYILHLAGLLEGPTRASIDGRDNPWDFSLALGSGRKLFVEITAIADSEQQFVFNAAEERLLRCSHQEQIAVHELRKLGRMFPGSGDFANVSPELPGRLLVDNPIYGGGPSLFVSVQPDLRSTLEDEVRAAIQRKVDKPHDGKERTVLLIDNRTGQYDLPDWKDAIPSLAAFCENLPFREVWLYTGHCSDDDGNNAEFSFSPIKVTNDQADVLSAIEFGSSGTYVWS